MSTSNSLFQLIKSLTQTEKRYFKIYSGSKEENYIKLFNAIDKQKEYNEEAIVHIFRKERFIGRFSYEKNYLFKSILKSMRNYHSEQTYTRQIREVMDNIEFLTEKKQYKMADKFMLKAKKTAYSHEMFEELVSLLDVERTLIRITITSMENTFFVNYQIRLEKINQEKLLVKNRLEKIIELKGHEDWLYIWGKTQDTAMKIIAENKIQEIKQRLKNNLCIHSNSSITERYLYYSVSSMTNVYSGRLLESYDDLLKLQQIMEANIFVIQKIPTKFINNLANLVRICTMRKDFKNAFFWLEKYWESVRKTIADEEERDVLFLQKYSERKLGLLIQTREFEEGCALIKKIMPLFKKYEYFIEKPELVGFYFWFTYIYFSLDNYKEALLWLNKLLNEGSLFLKNVQWHTYLFNLLIHYELKHFELLEHLLRSYNRDLNKSGMLSEWQKLILRFIETLPLLQDKKKLSVACKKIIKGTFAARDDYESSFFISWIESKIEGRPFARIEKEKFLLNKSH